MATAPASEKSFSRHLDDAKSSEGLLVGFDLETTGVDPMSDRIVSAAVVLIDGRTRRTVERHEWLVHDPWEGSQASAECVAVHGIAPSLTLRAGRALRDVLPEIIGTLDDLTYIGRITHPIVGYNVQYDLAMLLAEAQREGLLHQLHFLKDAAVLDARILYCYHQWNLSSSVGRLEQIAPQLGVDTGNSHAAGDDAVSAVLVAAELIRQNADLRKKTLWELHDDQVKWYAKLSAWRHDVETWPLGLGTSLLYPPKEEPIDLTMEQMAAEVA